jgi:hypothetical protein|tara:strand:+ start:222 stop:374 length:153 start_codon:yes stop_codon:yes gene_type:complete
MDIIIKFLDAWTKQATDVTKSVIDSNAAMAKKMVEYSERPYTWIKETIKK